MATTEKNRSLDHALIALADPTRRAILRRLARCSVRVTDLAAPFPMSLNAVSKHIKLLERGALVQRRKVGREHILCFRPEPLRKVRQWITKQEAFWNASLQAIDQLLSEEDQAKEQP